MVGLELNGSKVGVVYAITNLAGFESEDNFVLALERALARGIRLVQVREKQLDRNALASLHRSAERLPLPIT